VIFPIRLSAYPGLNPSMSMSTSKIVVHIGDLFSNAPTGSVLVHACNTQGTWGSGIAQAFKQRFPQAHKIYQATCRDSGDALLGTTLLIDPQEDDTKANGGGQGYAIACLFTSRNYGRRKDPKDVILDSTRSAIVELKALLADNGMPVYGCRINAGAFRVPWEETVAVLNELDFGMTVFEIAP